jgi:hypothetical protein
MPELERRAADRAAEIVGLLHRATAIRRQTAHAADGKFEGPPRTEAIRKKLVFGAPSRSAICLRRARSSWNSSSLYSRPATLRAC